MAKKNIQSLVGQLFMVGFNGYSVPAEFKKFISDYNLGGTIYFKRNVQSPGQIAELSNEIQFTCRRNDSPGLFIAIDHEGGKINRLVKPFTKFPGNENLGDLGSPKVAFEFGMILGKELKAVGINVNFAPVVDVYTNSENTVMKSRCFSSDPEVCGRMGSAVCRGIQKMGVMAVAKHFPGHGDVKEDSHFALPKTDKPLSELDKLELIPFRRVIRSRVDGVMTAHILNTSIDPDYPATLSEKTMAILRNDLRFQRVVFADDLEMKAISDHYTPENAPVLAVKAGCDSLIYKGDDGIGVPLAAIESVIKAVEKKVISVEWLEKANQRVIETKKAYCDTKKPVDVTAVGNFIGLPDHFQLADIITRKEIPAGFGKDTDFS